MFGRPKAIIDWKQVDRLLEAGCTGTQVAARIGIHPDTLYIACRDTHNLTFSAYAEEKRASGDSILQQAQFQQAVKGNVTMLIWLGKQRLGQRDKSDVEINATFKKAQDLTDDELADVITGGN